MRGSSAFFAALILAGCSDQGRYPEQCATRLQGWKQPSDGHGVLILANKVRVLSNGALTWNGKAVSPEQLAEYSALVPTMNPIPFTILDIETGAPCSTVVEARRLIDEKAKCRADPEVSACGEGADPWALIGDVVFDGNPPEPFYPVPHEGNESR